MEARHSDARFRGYELPVYARRSAAPGTRLCRQAGRALWHYARPMGGAGQDRTHRRHEQSELAEQMEMQPITLTRLIDKLCDAGFIERRGDETDRRVNRLYLKKAARPLLGKLSGLRSELTATALEGINPSDAHRLLAQLESIKENVRNAIQNTPGEPTRKEQHYG